MKKILISLSLFLVYYLVQSQNNNLLPDLHNKLTGTKDSVRVVRLNQLGRYYVHQDNFDSANFYFEAALATAKKINFIRGQGWALGNLGTLNYKYGKFEKAMELHLMALKIGEKLNSYHDIAAAYNNISNIYLDQKKYDLVMESLLKAMEITRKAKDTISLAIIYANISNNYKDLNDYKNAEKYNNEGISLCNAYLSKSDNAGLDSANLISIRQFLMEVKGSLLEKQKKYSEALAIYLQLANESKNNLGIEGKATYHKHIADIYSKTGNFKKSLETCSDALALLKEDSISYLYMEIYEIQSRAYAGLSTYKKAFETHLLFKQLSDSILNKENLKTTNDLQTKYETEKKDQAISQLNKEKKSQRVIAGLAIGAAAVALGFLAFAIRSKRLQATLFKQKQELDKAALEKKMASLEQMALRAQMNPHFIFNSLTSIQNFVHDKEGQTADKFITAFSRLIRQTLDNSGKQLIPLNDEIKYLDNYLQLEQMRLRNKFQYSIQVQQNINKEETHIPGMILQPFVENSIKHGIYNKQNNDGYIRINVSKNGTLSCIVEDNGVGRKDAQLLKAESSDEYESKGIDITRSRIETINKIYEIHIALNIEDLTDDKGDPAGTRVKIDFPADL